MRTHKLLIAIALFSVIGVTIVYAGDPETLPSPQVLNRNPSVAANTYENTALIIWESAPNSSQQSGAVYVCLVTVANNGDVTLGTARKISTSTSNNGRPSIAFNPDTGTYLAAWCEYGNQAGIWVRELNDKGVPTADAVEIISDFATEMQPRIVYTGEYGDAYLLVYSRIGSSGAKLLERGIWAVALDHTGTPVDEEWSVLLGDIYQQGGQDVRSTTFAFDISAADGSIHIISTMYVDDGSGSSFTRSYVSWAKVGRQKAKNKQVGPDKSDRGRIAAIGKRWAALAWQEEHTNDSYYFNQAVRKHKTKKNPFEAKPGSKNKGTALIRVDGGAALVYTIPESEMFLQKLNAKGKKVGAAKSLGKFDVFDLRGALLADGNQLIIAGITSFSTISAEIQAFSVQLNQ